MAYVPDPKDPTKVVDGLVGAIKSIAADPNYHLLADVFSEVLHLRAKNTELNNASRNIFEQYWQFRREYEDALASVENAKAAVQKELDSTVDELRNLTEAHGKLGDKLTSTKSTLGETVSAKEKLEADLETAHTELTELRSIRTNLETEVSQLTSQLEEQKHLSEIAAQQNAALQVSISQKDTELEKVKAELESTNQNLQEAISRGDSLKMTLHQVQADLTAKTTRLTELDSYRVVLKEEPEDVFVRILDNVWAKLFNLVEKHFRQDLDDKVLNDPSCWNNLRTAEALRGPALIPLPQTNSPVAKAMRISAVLSVLSRTLHRHIFRPTYLLEEDDELTDVLHKLEDNSPVKEEHIRATLLAAIPDYQQTSAKARTQRVVREVSWTVQHLLGALAYDSFCNNLSSACALACNEWQRIQHAKTKIEPYFGPPYDDFDWQELPLPQFEGRNGTPIRCSRANSTTRHASPKRSSDAGRDAEEAPEQDGDGADKEKQEGQASEDAEAAQDDEPENKDKEDKEAESEAQSDETDDQDEIDDAESVNDDGAIDSDDEEDTEVDPSNILLVVWPCMVVVENGDQQGITQGLVVSTQQASLAYHEVRAARSGLRNTKRARTMSIPSMPFQSGCNTPSRAFLLGGDCEKESVA